MLETLLQTLSEALCSSLDPQERHRPWKQNPRAAETLFCFGEAPRKGERGGTDGQADDENQAKCGKEARKGQKKGEQRGKTIKYEEIRVFLCHIHRTVQPACLSEAFP